MNDYSYKSLREGVQQEFSVTVTEQMVEDFRKSPRKVLCHTFC